MWFLVWLAGSFLVVTVINLYLRHFGLPRRPITGSTGSITGDGRVSSTSFSLSHSFGGGGGASALSPNSASPTVGETAHWINHIFAWIYQQAPVTGGQKFGLLEVWLRSLTEQAQYQTGNVKIKFDSVHGSPPEFSNFSVNPSSTVATVNHGYATGVSAPATGATPNELTVNMSVLAKDITLQISILPPNTDSSRVVFADVYLIHVQGQFKLTINKTTTNGETPVQLSFVSAPELRLQILPSGRLDASIDVNTIERTVRSALCQAVVDITWSTTGGFRDSHVSTQQAPIRTDNTQSSYTSPMTSSTTGGQIINQQAMFGGNNSPQLLQNFSDPYQSSLGYRDQNQMQQQQQQQQQLLSNSSLTPYSQQPVGSLQQQQQLQSQQSQQLLQQRQQQFVQEQPFNSLQMQQQMPPLSPSMSRTSDMMTRPIDGALQDSFGNRVTHRLLVKVIKANGLADDLGSCNAFCAVRVDRPVQNFTTSVVRNTVNPMWDEQFVFDVDNLSRQVQFEVLDRDKPPDSELLGKAVVHLDEIRRMPSSRQILPLTGRVRSRTSTTGSVTVEFMLVDAGETLRMPINDNLNSMTVNQQTMQPLSTGNIPQSNSYGASYNDPMMKSNVMPSNMTPGEFSAYQNRLSAHDLALSQQVGNKSHESPTLIVTGSEFRDQRVNMMGTLDGRGRVHEPKESFASALKKRLSRAGGKKRSQSADRAQPYSKFEGNSYLRPPGDSSQGYRTTDALDDYNADHKARSNSFTSSIRRIFKPSSPGGVGDVGRRDLSRESSLTKNQTAELTQQQYQQQLQQQQQQDYNYDRSLRQNTPVPPDRRTVDQYGRTSSNADYNSQYVTSPSGTLNTGRRY